MIAGLLEMGSYAAAVPDHRNFFSVRGEFLAFLRGERRSPPVSADDSLRNILVLEAIGRSIETGEVQPVEWDTRAD